MIAASFLIFLLIFLFIGLSSLIKSGKTQDDYLVAGKSIAPWLAGLSAVATNNSGFMFIGMIGLTYATGLSSIWLMIGWIAGDFLASLIILRPLHRASRSDEIHSYGGLIAHWYGQNHVTLRRIVGVFTILFLSLYAAAQLKAGSKATMVLLDWQPSWGVIIGAVIVLLYSAAGGIRASIWTDAAQSIVMIIGMVLLIFGGVSLAGGWDASVEKMVNITPHYLSWFPDTDFLGITLFILGWVFGGVTVFGQPQIVVRFIALDNESNINRMRVYYYVWFTLFYGAAILVGLLSRIAFPDTSVFDAELALPALAKLVLPDVMTGLILAALFSATLSTADSLILACSASVTRDFTSKVGKLQSLWAAKLTTACVLLVAVIIALTGAESVFALVLDAWGLLGSAFMPLILLLALGKQVSQLVAIIMVVSGVVAFIIWQQLGLGGLIYSVAPGVLVGLMCGFIGDILFKNKGSN
ncbi:sodium/proline symporter PutP [Oceaniserpentilla sp. 4NH20-0058]|uniref:sodium/proline symporter n=1 Tax=Oceaniserpentilla sp. 4NH20-0058 TaxID=3127660 RepID=UPI00310501FC